MFFHFESLSQVVDKQHIHRSEQSIWRHTRGDLCHIAVGNVNYTVSDYGYKKHYDTGSTFAFVSVLRCSHDRYIHVYRVGYWHAENLLQEKLESS